MKESTLTQLTKLVERAVEPVTASPRRKRTMRDELFLHLCDRHHHEMQKIGDETVAMAAACERFGDADEVRRQLQATVPLFERAFYACIGEKETPMSRVLWIASIVVIAAGVIFSFPYRDEVHLCGVALLVGMILRHLCQKENLAVRLLGPQWRWWIGTAGIAIGPALVLPALAKIKVYHVYTPAFFIALGVGILITLSGVCFVVLAINRRRARVAE